MESKKIDKKNILFVTTSLFTESLIYQKKQLKKFFDESEKIVIDGRNNWPKKWYEWIDVAINSEKEWIIHIDEDCFVLDDKNILNEIIFMLENNLGISGCPDGHHEYRNCNHMAINSFFMIIKRETLLKWKEFLKKGIEFPQFNKEWLKEYPYEKRNKSIILEKQGWEKWERGSEPYYNFMWVLKYMDVNFHYLEPGFDKLNFCTTLLENTILHAWHLRQINENKIVSSLHNLTNKERYQNIFNTLK